MQKIKTIIADDHQLFADGLSNIVQQAGDIELTGCVNNGEELMKTLAGEETHLVLLDISMPRMNGLEAAAAIRKLYPNLRILVVTMNDSIDIIRSLMDLEVNGIVPKNAGKAELLLAIKEICHGRDYFSQKITKQLASGYRLNSQDKWQLTKREREVLQLVYEGLSTTEIAEKLFISNYTVETHKKNLFVKSGLNKSSQLVKEALELGYLRSHKL